MALSKDVQTIWGLFVQAAYHRVEALQITSKERIKFHVRSYTSTENNIPWFSESVIEAPYVLDGSNPIHQAYEYLKTLPEFADATDR